MEIKLTLTTYNVELENKINKDPKEGEEEFILTPNINSLNKVEDFVSKEEFTFNSEEVNIGLKIQELSEKARIYNTAQLKIAKSLKNLKMRYQIVTK